MLRLAAVLFAAWHSAACHSAAPSPVAEPTEVMPLPPASGTPIGLLLDESARLSLRPEQIDELRAIDEQLVTRNDALATEERGHAEPSAGPPPGRGGGRGPRGGGGGMSMGGGGMGGGGMGGGMGGPPGGGGGPRRGGGAPDGARRGPPPNARSRARIEEEQRANLADALARTMRVLDAEQRVIAEQLFDERGIRNTATPPSGEPREPEPNEPSASDR